MRGGRRPRCCERSRPAGPDISTSVAVLAILGCARPYGERQMSSPQSFRLTTGARILRGSKRIGLFLGAIALLIGVAVTMGSAYNSAGYTVSTYEQARCLSRKTDARLVADQYGSSPAQYRFADNGCPGKAYSATEAEVRTILTEGAPSFGSALALEAYAGLIFSALAAAAIFGVCWGLGWVVTGFTAD